MAATYTQQLLSVIKSLTDQDDYETRLLLDEKVNRILTATEGNLVSFDSDGNIQDSTFSIVTEEKVDEVLDTIFPIFRETFTNPYVDSTDTTFVEQFLIKFLDKQNEEDNYWKVTGAVSNNDDVTFTLVSPDQVTETQVVTSTTVALTMTTKADLDDTEKTSEITFGELATVFDNENVDSNLATLLDQKLNGTDTGLSISYKDNKYTITNIIDGDYILFVLDNSTTNTVIRIDKTIDEGVDGARITVERFTTPWEYIRMGFNWIQLNAVTLNNGKVTFEGLESNPFSSYGTPTSRAYNAENEAFEFGLEYNNGEDYTYIAITYGEWYEVISDTSCTFTDFANLVNNKLVEAECPFDVRYDDSEKCFIVTSSVWDSFSVLNIYSHGWFGDWDEVTFPPTEEEEDPNEPHL